MPFDLVIRNGTVVDGSGRPSYRADVGIAAGRIVEIGRIDERGGQELDAEGHVVSPGFIDAHTHMDAQVFWDRLGSSSCWHGVTSVVMGNCGFTLAPSRPGQEQLVLDNLEKAEDIPAEAMKLGIDWTWESFAEYQAAVEATPKAINYGTQVGHSAVRTFVMGERAFGGAASDDDLRAMAGLVRGALRAGALGFTTSISDHHETPDGRPIASRSASWAEVQHLAAIVGELGGGMFQLAIDTSRAESSDAELALSFYRELQQLAIETGVTTSYGLRSQHLREQLDILDSTHAAGGSIIGLCQSIVAAPLWSFATTMPYDRLPVWRELRARPESEQLVALRDPVVRAQLASAAVPSGAGWTRVRGPGDYLALRGPWPYQSVEEIAAARGVTPCDAMLDLALETDFRQVFSVAATPADDEAVLTAMRHPRTIVTFSDAGAHVRMLSGADLHTTLLAKWVREREAFTLEKAVRMVTSVPANAWRIADRGLVREGMVADVNVFDAASIAPSAPMVAADLPGGSRRIVQRAVGIRATVVGGRTVFADGEHTGELPGTLIRGPLAS